MFKRCIFGDDCERFSEKHSSPVPLWLVDCTVTTDCTHLDLDGSCDLKDVFGYWKDNKQTRKEGDFVSNTGQQQINELKDTITILQQIDSELFFDEIASITEKVCKLEKQ